jgi:hypothetical protein
MKDTLVVFYRISDLTQKTASGEAFDKKRPSWWSKEKSFLNFVNVYGTEHLFVIADAVGDSTKKWLRSKVPVSQIIHTDYKSGAFSFLFAARLASKLPGNSKILFAEDDYVWCSDSKQCLLEALDIADYATPYDHLDKYQNAGTVHDNGCVGNPLISDNSEVTRLYVTESCHLKVTNSTTVTFATKAKTVKADLDLFEKYCSSGFPRDFELFRELITERSRKLVSTVPARATHCESAYLAPTIDWQVVQQTASD